MCVCIKIWIEFFEKNPDGRYFYATTKAPHAYHEAEYRDGDYLMFGKETRVCRKRCSSSTRNAAFAFP